MDIHLLWASDLSCVMIQILSWSVKSEIWIQQIRLFRLLSQDTWYSQLFIQKCIWNTRTSRKYGCICFWYSSRSRCRYITASCATSLSSLCDERGYTCASMRYWASWEIWCERTTFAERWDARSAVIQDILDVWGLWSTQITDDIREAIRHNKSDSEIHTLALKIDFSLFEKMLVQKYFSAWRLPKNVRRMVFCRVFVLNYIFHLNKYCHLFWGGYFEKALNVSNVHALYIFYFLWHLHLKKRHLQRKAQK